MARQRRGQDQRAAIQAALDHQFRNQPLLDEALTHSSLTRLAREGEAVSRSNERLEFLGDRVLGLIVAHLLIESFPDEPEGALSRRQDALVRRDMLSEVAREIGVGPWLYLSRSEEDGGGRSNPTILADCCEALIGALYLDGGHGVAERFVRKYWTPRLRVMGRPPRDAKTELQEWSQAQGLPLPVYTVVGQDGPDHAPTFEIDVVIAGHEPQRARGNSKRNAEQQAAGALLERIASRRDT